MPPAYRMLLPSLLICSWVKDCPGDEASSRLEVDPAGRGSSVEGAALVASLAARESDSGCIMPLTRSSSCCNLARICFRGMDGEWLPTLAAPEAPKNLHETASLLFTHELHGCWRSHLSFRFRHGTQDTTCRLRLITLR